MKNWIVLILAGSMAFAGTRINLEQAVKTDLIGGELVTTVAKNVVENEAPREAISMSWALAADAELKLASTAPEVSSTDFWMSVRGSDFNEGIALNVSQGGALVRISPNSKGAAMPHLEDFVLVNQEGLSFSQGRGLNGLLDPEQVEAAKHTPFGEGTAVFRLHENLGAGEVILFADNMAYDAQAKYTIHVRELNSEVTLTARTDRHNYLAGQTLRVDAGMSAGTTAMTIDSMLGTLVSPTGRTWSLNFANGVATLPLTDGTESAFNGLWEVRISALGNYKDSLVRRDLRSAFAIGETTAQLTGTAEIERTAQALVADLDVEVGVPGRYEVRGVLMGTNSKGALQPIAMGHSAIWLDAGLGKISLSYEAHLLEDSKLSAPYMVKDLRLIHQNRMSLQAQYENGFRFSFDR